MQCCFIQAKKDEEKRERKREEKKQKEKAASVKTTTDNQPEIMEVCVFKSSFIAPPTVVMLPGYG